MWDKIKNAFSASSLAAARNVLMAVAGFVGALGFMSATQANHIVDAIMNVGTALAALIAAISALVMIATPIFAAFKASPAQQKKSVSLQPNTLVVETTSPTKSANSIATLPDVTQVVATPAVATATPSDKVVAK